MKSSILILGLGNTIVSDDRVGIDMSNLMATEFSLPTADSQAVHLGLLSELEGFDTLLIIDSIKTEQKSIKNAKLRIVPILSL